MSVVGEKQNKKKDDTTPDVFPLNIKIKQEKTTSYEDSSKSATVDKLSIDVNLTNIFTTTITSSSAGEKRDETVDVKPSVEPLKSSNEILTELFRVFNAAPPEIIEDDSNDGTENPEKKKKKKHKHKKKSRRKQDDASETDEEQAGKTLENGDIRMKRKKIKKEKDREGKHEKHEKHKRRHRGETLLVTVKQEPLYKQEKKTKHEGSKEHNTTKQEDTKPKDSSKLAESKAADTKQPPLKGKIQIKSLKDSVIFKELATGCSYPKERNQDKYQERDKSWTKSENSVPVRKRKLSGSDISLSEGEENGKGRYYDFYQKKYNSFYASYEQSEEDRDRQERKRCKRSEEKDRDRDRERHRHSGSRSRTRSRSHSPEQFDKQKLLEIARKNAITMLKKGTLPGAQNLDGDSKTKLISKMHARGKTIEELTEFCKKISNKDNFNDLSSVSSDESDHDADGASKVFHHPFQLKEPAPIVMNIRNATTIQPKSAEEKKAILMQFPVSSGAHHRCTETEWVPVEKPKNPTSTQAKPGVSGVASKPKHKAILPPSSSYVPQQMPSSEYSPSHLPQSDPSVVAVPNATVPPLVQPAAAHAPPGTCVPQPLFPPNDIAQPYHALHLSPIVPSQPPLAPSHYNGMPSTELQSLVLPVDTTIPPPTINPIMPAQHPDQRRQQRLLFSQPHPNHHGPSEHRSGNEPGQIHGRLYGQGLAHGPGHGPVHGPGHGLAHGPVHGPGHGPAHGPVHGPAIGPGHGPRIRPGHGPGHGPGSANGPGAANGPGSGSDNVFHTQPDAPMLDVSQIVSQRLNAMRKLQENPSDPKARQLLHNTQKDMSTWASSKVMPGQFVGSTGVNCLSQRELAEGYQPWATRDMMKQATPVTGGMGMHLLQKMGWQPGEGLGKEKNGSLQPLLLDVKLDKRGLGEGPNKGRGHQLQGQGQGQGQGLFTRRGDNARPASRGFMSADGKHPVSLLGEYATKRKWSSPRYELVHESGPGHAKSFIFKVLVDGLEYQPAIANNTKKEAKATAAKFCLQQLGVMIT